MERNHRAAGQVEMHGTASGYMKEFLLVLAARSAGGLGARAASRRQDERAYTNQGRDGQDQGKAVVR
jgi:hypothetical protein